MRPRVSIIIATYNTDAYVSMALSSVINQTEQDFEIIVCDDCSTDSTVEIVSRYAKGDDRIHLITSSRNSGPSRSRNRAIRLAQGEWIAILDSDDYFDRKRLSVLLCLAEISGFEMMADNLNLIDEEGNVVTPRAFNLPKISEESLTVSVETFVKNDSFSGHALNWGFMKPIIRRSFLIENQIAFDENIRLGEDFVFYVECLLKGARLGIINRAFYFYREVHGSLSRRGDFRNFVSLRENNLKLIRLARQLHRPEVQEVLWKRDKELQDATLYARFVALIRTRNIASALHLFRENPVSWPFFTKKVMRYLIRVAINTLRNTRPKGP